MPFDVTILGSNSALPAHGRNPTSQVLQIHDHLWMIDCGEGTQLQMQKYKIRPGKLDRIFISHLHGDHIFGLVGLLTSLNLNRRSKTLHLYCHEGLDEILKIHFHYSKTILSFELIFHPFSEEEELIYEDESVMVYTLNMAHRIPCKGFLFQEVEGLRRMNKDAIARFELTHDEIIQIKSGVNIQRDDGILICAEDITEPPHPPRSYAFCTDTLYRDDLIENFKLKKRKT
jgi:ribonuclease Z